ncbi:MAG: tripartite tricarboxylate transporter TctB family protein [Blautia sp.]|nr:tripartite tricarboxylate transporter TctB family protein [Blautia sp.]
MEIKYKSNLAAGIVSLILGVICLILVPLQIAKDYSATYGITSRTVPYAIGILWIVCGVILLVQSIVLKKDTEKTLVVGKELKALAYMVILLAYGILFKRSFLISTILLGVATLAMTGTKKKLFYVIVIAMVVVLYLLFAKVLHIQMP